MLKVVWLLVLGMVALTIECPDSEYVPYTSLERAPALPPLNAIDKLGSIGVSKSIRTRIVALGLHP